MFVRFMACAVLALSAGAASAGPNFSNRDNGWQGGNFAWTNQDGAFNFSLIGQAGSGNVAVVNQDGEGNVAITVQDNSEEEDDD